MNLAVAGAEPRTITPPRSWEQLDTHYLRALDDPWYRAMFRIQDTISTATVDFYRGEGLQTVHVPVTTSSISSPMGLGSDSLPVAVDLFGVRTYLADSMQFMLEYGCRLADRGCYYLMPSFRGEAADESHLCQFYHSEAEIRGGLDDVIGLVERYVRALAGALLDQCGERVQGVAGSVVHVEALARTGSLPRVTVAEAVRMLQADPRFCERRDPGFTVLTRAGEQELIRRFGGFVWLTRFDHLSVPFYQAFTEDGEHALAADLLMGMGETVGCGERHATGAEVDRALALHQVERSGYEWYCTMKDRYPMQTAGFGLGVERFICWLLSHSDVRDCQLAPRFNGVPSVP